MIRIFISHILPKDYMLRYNLSVAACNFSWNLINGGVFDKFYSIMPTYVKNSLDDVDMPELVYSSLRSKGGVLSKIAILHENWIIFRHLPKDCSVWLYNISSLNIPLFFLLKWFRPQTKKNIIILDYTPKKDLLSRLCLWVLNHADGTIKLAPSPLFTVKNTACLPGVTPSNDDVYPKQTNINKEFLLSGVLNERISMLSMVLSAFSHLPELTLHITGFIEDEELIREYQTCNNIHYHGKLSYDDYLKVFHQVSFQLSTRDPQSPENQCNFPSKVMEALLHNRIIVSTIPYPQLGDVRLFVVPSEQKSFEKELVKITDLDNQTLLTYSNQSDTVRKEFDAKVWKESMELIEKRIMQ